MEKKSKKRICLCISLFVICISAVFIAANRMSADYDIEYESLNTEHKTDMTKKEDYQKADLEMKLQDTIQSIAEGSNPLVSIHNFDTADHSETTVAVTLYTDSCNEISEESQIAIENLILGSFNGILKDNISINIECTER
ncbi:MAG: hypothetical protein HFH10_04675 [Dorea sp.]|nr:hypothetical protein [Dorea sp.]